MLKSLGERLDEKIDKSGGPEACWPWVGYFNGGKYGALYAEGVQRPATVWVLMRKTGEQPNGRLACHTCDNPPCCNDAHLYWGSHQDNTDDRERRGRSNRLRGERHGCAKLTEPVVREIRARHKSRDRTNSASALGREFGVHTSLVHKVIHNQVWAHI